MVEGLDPYNPEALVEVNRHSGVSSAWADYWLGGEALVYPPTTLFLLTPFGLLHWELADDLWLLLAGLSYALAALLVWDLSADYAPVMAGLTLGAFTATSLLLMMSANPTMPAVALCAIAVWCVMRQRMEWVGVLCMALSLMLKPQMGGFIWLYFLVSSPVYRRFAWKVLGATVAMSIPAIAWISLMPASRQWLPELYSIVSASITPGAPASPVIGNRSSFNMLNLQTIFGVFWDNPRIYNGLTYGIVGPMIAVWMWVTAKRVPTRGMTYLGVVAGALLSLLPVYHRVYDFRLLLLLFPAAMMLWARRGKSGWLALGCVAAVTLIAQHRLLVYLDRNIDILNAGPVWMRLSGRSYAFVALAVTLIIFWMYVEEGRQGARQEIAGAEG